eukprot:4268491-Prymnesium_polylepis.2
MRTGSSASARTSAATVPKMSAADTVHARPRRCLCLDLRGDGLLGASGSSGRLARLIKSPALSPLDAGMPSAILLAERVPYGELRFVPTTSFDPVWDRPSSGPRNNG